MPASDRVDRGRRDAALGGGRNRPVDRRAAGIRHDAPDAAPLPALGAQRAAEQPQEGGVGAQDPARDIDDGEREGRGVEQPREADLGGALRLVLRALRASIEHERARGAGFPVMSEGDAVQHAHRHGLAAALLEVDVEDIGHHVARRAGEMGDQRRGVSRHHIGELEPARSDLREIMIEPGGERRVHVGDGARGIDRHEARRRMVEIVDRLLQLLEDVLLALAVAGDVGNRPQRLALAFAARDRLDAQAIPGDPARGAAHRLGEADLLHGAAALACRLRQAIDRLRHFRRAREQALDGRDGALQSAPGTRRDRPRWRRRSVRRPR